MQFIKLKVKNSFRWVDMPLKSISQSINVYTHFLCTSKSELTLTPNLLSDCLSQSMSLHIYI